MKRILDILNTPTTVPEIEFLPTPAQSPHIVDQTLGLHPPLNNPYMNYSMLDELNVKQPTWEHLKQTTNFDIKTFMPKLYEVETMGGKLKDRPGSNYSGIAQLGYEERKPYLQQLGITDNQYKADRNLQKKVATKWIGGLHQRLLKNGFEPTPLNIWIAHNQGVGGLNQILKGDVSKTVLNNIRSQKGMNKNSTVQDYLNYYSKIFN